MNLDRLMTWAGWCLFAIIVFNAATTYGERWTIGPRYFMPVTLLSADGMHYTDGTPAPALVVDLVNSDCEPEVYLGFTLVMLALAVCTAFLILSMERNRKRYFHSVVELERLYREERERRAAMRRPSPHR